MSEFIGPEADAWNHKLDKQYYLLRLEATEQIGSLALWRVLEDLNIWRRYLLDHDPHYEENRRIYNAIMLDPHQEGPRGKHARGANGNS